MGRTVYNQNRIQARYNTDVAKVLGRVCQHLYVGLQMQVPVSIQLFCARNIAKPSAPDRTLCRPSPFPPTNYKNRLFEIQLRLVQFTPTVRILVRVNTLTSNQSHLSIFKHFCDQPKSTKVIRPQIHQLAKLETVNQSEKSGFTYIEKDKLFFAVWYRSDTIIIVSPHSVTLKRAS